VRATLRAVRFYRVVTPVAPLMTAAFGGVTAAGAAAVLLSPAGAPHAPVPVLLLQVFAVSTGFLASARRGHYDALMTGGVGRLRAAVVQWAMSALPGVTACTVLLALGAVAPDGAPTAHPWGTLAALSLVSTLPWAVTVGLPRFAGAIGWLLVIVTAAALVPAQYATGVPPSLMFLLVPIVAVHAGPTSLAALGPGIAVAAAAMIGALCWIARTDLPLEASQ
jgi:hypothetical protein